MDTNHAYSFTGYARAYTPNLPHIRCVYFNRLLGNTESLQIKRLAFPI